MSPKKSPEDQIVDFDKLDFHRLHHAQKIIMPFHELERIDEIKEGLSFSIETA